MFRKIVTILQPFDLKQIIFIYENGNKIKAIEIETANIAEEICKTAQSFNIKEINLGGAEQYSKGIAKKIKEISITQYSIDNLEIKYL